ncbi:methyl-accepting chemotaxis protein [Oceanirhabdus seepicola]|uniref:Methyl-accepting chemotaxis protein n=1 Tax=Oceanirhabdus seepicola TaxID=2828781 RepID=A0A9J6NY43_9CLOT|nr:methyl-accepting chemotaxis protein [Oceanirhabdus seepicola]MCM1988980.1 methyl-accepting chemotaxis protein [Oceanirhabdus seepicola]
MKLKSKIILIIGILVIFILTALTVFNISSANNMAEEIVEQQITMQLESVEKSILTAEEIVNITMDELDRKNINLAKSIAEIIKADPTKLETSKITDLAKSLKVEEIHVIDENGIIANGNIPEFFGFDCKASEQTKPFLELMNQVNGELAQVPSKRGTDQKMFQYIGVSRLDQKGIVQIGVSVEAIESITSKMDVQKTIENLYLGKNGFAYIADTSGVIINHKDPSQIGKNLEEVTRGLSALLNKDKMSKLEVHDVNYYVKSRKLNDSVIMIALPAEKIEGAYKSNIRNSSIIGIVGFLILIALINITIGKTIIKPIQEIESYMKKVGEGYFDLKLEVKSKDEIGNLSNNFNKMVDNVRNLVIETHNSVQFIADESIKINETVNGLSMASNHVTQAVESIANGSADMAQEVDERVELSKELSNRIEEMSSMIEEARSNTDNMNNSNKEGKESIVILNDKFRVTVHSTDEVDEKISELNEKSKSILSIVESIKSVSEQTNLLSLNASIEAARAGEHGRGFAVVAEEVRKLAEESGQATKEIAEIIGSVVQIVNDTNNTMETARVTVKEANHNLNNTNSVFEEIDGNTNFVASSISKLAKDMEFVNTAKEQLVNALEAIATLSQESAAATEEISASTEEQSAQINEIASSVEKFNNNIKNLEREMNKFKL